jgi:hypothetical protein
MECKRCGKFLNPVMMAMDNIGLCTPCIAIMNGHDPRPWQGRGTRIVNKRKR